MNCSFGGGYGDRTFEVRRNRDALLELANVPDLCCRLLAKWCRQAQD